MQSQNRFNCDCFSPSHASFTKLRELLRAGSLKTRSLDRLREKVHQQRVDRKCAVTANDQQHTIGSHGGQISRKICRVKSDPSRPPCTFIVGRHNDIHAMKKAKPALEPCQKVLQRKNSDPNRTGGEQMTAAKQHQPVVRGRSPSPGISNGVCCKSTQIPKTSIKRDNTSSSRKSISLKFPISAPRGSSNSRENPFPSVDKPVRLLGKCDIPSEVLLPKSPSLMVPALIPSDTYSCQEKLKGCERAQGPQRCGASEVREFMDQKQRERRRKELQKKEELQREEAQRKARIQEVLHKQKMALNRAKRRPKNLPQLHQGVEETCPGQNLEVMHCGRQGTTARRTSKEKGNSKAEGPSLSAVVHAVESRTQRVQALRRAAFVLENRVEEEASRLRVAAVLTPYPSPGLTGPTLRPESQSTSIIKHHARTKEQPTDPVEQLHSLEGGRDTPLSNHSDSSDKTNTTSKWSELSGFFGHRELLGHLSLTMFQQFLREEELRARHQSALFRLREEALWEKTQMEIAWLEHRRRCMRVGEVCTLADITRKQEEVLSRMRQEQVEIQHWRNLYRLGRQQRKLLLRQQKEVVEIRRSAVQLKQKLQEQESAHPEQREAAPQGNQPPHEDGWSLETKTMPPCIGEPLQERNNPAAQPGVTVDKRGRNELSEEASLEPKVLEDCQQLGWRTVFVKTDTGSWNWQRWRTSDKMAPTEQGELRVPKVEYPGSLAVNPEKVQLPSQKSIEGEKTGWGENDKGLVQSETRRMTGTHLEQNYPTAFVSEGRPLTLPPPAITEELSPPGKLSQEEELLWSDDSSSSGGPLRVRSLPNFAEVSWKSQRSVSSFASLPEFQRAAAVCMNISEISGPSSDVEEDLPFDGQDGGWRQEGLNSEPDWEQSNNHDQGHCAAPEGKPKEGMGSMVTLNIQNNQRSQTMLTTNNNCLIMPSSCALVAEDCPGMLIQAGSVTGLFSSGQPHSLGSPDPDAGSRECSSADYSLSETEEVSEVLSISSECLNSSEGEDPERANLGIEVFTEGQDQAQLSLPSEPGKSTSVIQKTFQASPDERQQILGEHTSERELERKNPDSLLPLCKQPAPEETLSEILSPVDEVLSYGSTELPPTVTDDLLLLPPPPACEVITWTSEDASAPPPNEQCEPHPLEDPSIKSDDLPSLSDDQLLPGSTGLHAGLSDKRGNNGDFLKVDLVTTGYIAGERLSKHQGKEDMKFPQMSALSVAEDEHSNSSDSLFSFCIGDRVLVCGSRPGQLRFKGVTSFASGQWAGVALDHPLGHHDGMFRGVRYFQCSKNCGVLVRAEDISHLLSEQESDLETRADDSFSDEEPPSAAKPPQDREGECMDISSGTASEKSRSQSQGGDKNGSAGHSLAPIMSRDGFSRQQSNNFLSSTTMPEKMVMFQDHSALTSFQGFHCSIHEAERKEDPHCKSHQLQQIMPEAEKLEFHPNSEEFKDPMFFRQDLKIFEDYNDLQMNRSPQTCLESQSVLITDIAPVMEQTTSHTPLDCLRSSLEKGEKRVQLACRADPHEQKVSPGGRCLNDLDSVVDSLMGTLLMEVVKEAKKVRTKYQAMSSTLRKENYIQNPALRKDDWAQVKPGLNPNSRPSLPYFSDQWRYSLASAAQPRVQVRPHESAVLQKLVEKSVEALWSQTGGCVVNSTEAPAYLACEDGRKAYRQVIFDLTSDIYHKALRHHLGTSMSSWELKEISSFKPVWSSKMSLSNAKAAIHAEVQKELNMERTDVQTREMMQRMCKCRAVPRDRVDYVLIQELYKEEQQWVDYSLDQLSVKMRLAEEIFDILLQDTISVLNHIYAVPSGESPPALQPTQSSLG